MLLLRSLALAAPAQDPPGAILPTTQAAAAASASTTLGAADFATRLAESGNVYRQFTCEVEDIDATCPGVKALASVNAQEDLLKVPPNERWLFYGPSYMLQMFQTVVTANTELIVEDGSFVDDNEEFAQMRDRIAQACMPAGAATKATNLRAMQGDAMECNRLNADATCASGTTLLPTVYYKLSNGGVLYGINNSPIFQDQQSEDSMQVLKAFLSQADVTLDRIWYMEPHGDDYHVEHCAAQKEGRDVDPSKVLDENKMDMCYVHDEPDLYIGEIRADAETSTTAAEYLQCAVNRPAYQLLYEHVKARASKSMMLVAPWAVDPDDKAPANREIEYRSYAVGNKYPCVAGGSTPGAKHYGLGRGACYPGYQSQHPCTTICDATSCTPGPAAKMVVDMVSRAQGVIAPEDFTGYTGVSPEIVAMQRACDGCDGCPANHAGCSDENVPLLCADAVGVEGMLPSIRAGFTGLRRESSQSGKAVAMVAASSNATASAPARG